MPPVVGIAARTCATASFTRRERAGAGSIGSRCRELCGAVAIPVPQLAIARTSTSHSRPGGGASLGTLQAYADFARSRRRASRRVRSGNGHCRRRTRDSCSAVLRDGVPIVRCHDAEDEDGYRPYETRASDDSGDGARRGRVARVQLQQRFFVVNHEPRGLLGWSRRCVGVRGELRDLDGHQQSYAHPLRTDDRPDRAPLRGGDLHDVLQRRSRSRRSRSRRRSCSPSRQVLRSR